MSPRSAGISTKRGNYDILNAMMRSVQTCTAKYAQAKSKRRQTASTVFSFANTGHATRSRVMPLGTDTTWSRLSGTFDKQKGT